MKKVVIEVHGDEREVGVEPVDTAGRVLGKLDLLNYLLQHPKPEVYEEFFDDDEIVFFQVEDGQHLTAEPKTEVGAEDSERDTYSSPGVPDQWYLLTTLRVTLGEAAWVSGVSEERIVNFTLSGHLESSGNGEYLYTADQVQKAAYISIFRDQGYSLEEATNKAEEKQNQAGWGKPSNANLSGPMPTWKLLVAGIRYGLKDTFREVITDPNFQEILFEEIMQYPTEDTNHKTQGGD